MTTAEFSAELDTIYENLNKNGAPGLDDYERSVILTHAQELFVKEMVKVEPSAFPQLIETYIDSTPTSSPMYSWGTVFNGVSNGSNKVIQILNEEIIDSNDNVYTVIPLSAVQYDKKQISPYKYPPRRRAWRVESLSSSINKVEILPRPNITLTDYKVRYVRKPKPIIISDLQTLSPFAMGVVATYTVSTPGTGYSVGDVLTLTTGTSPATFRVLTLSGSTVLTVGVLDKGYGNTAGAKATTSVPSAGRSGCQITITVANASTIDGEYSPQTSELDASWHRDILKIAATLAEQYYYDKYGTDGNK